MYVSSSTISFVRLIPHPPHPTLPYPTHSQHPKAKHYRILPVANQPTTHLPPAPKPVCNPPLQLAPPRPARAAYQNNKHLPTRPSPHPTEPNVPFTHSFIHSSFVLLQLCHAITLPAPLIHLVRIHARRTDRCSCLARERALRLPATWVRGME